MVSTQTLFSMSYHLGLKSATIVGGINQFQSYFWYIAIVGIFFYQIDILKICKI